MGTGFGVIVPRYDLARYAQITRVVSATQFVASGLAGFGDSYFVGYSVWVLRKADGTTTAPKDDAPAAINAYVSSSGTVTHNAFSANLAAGDEILILHPTLATILTSLGPGGMNQGLVYYGVVTGIPGANQFAVAGLQDLGDTKFVNWTAYVLRDAGGAGAAPQGESQAITAYTSATGAFTTAAFTAAVAVGDEVLIMHPFLGAATSTGLSYTGTVDAVPGANQFTISSLAGLGAGAFVDLSGVNPYYAFVFRDGGGGGAAPQGEIQPITNYADATGNFTANAFSVPVAVGDEVVILHPSLARIFNLYGQPPVTGSLPANWQAAEQNLVSIGAANTKYKLHSLVLDINALVGTVTIRLYMEVVGVERRVYQQAFTVAADGPGIWIVNGTMGIHEVLRVTVQSDNAADNGQAVGYDYMLEVM